MQAEENMPKPIFHENVVIITGASSGIGRELAFQLADQGAWLSLGARNLEQLETAAEECRQRRGRALVTQTDVTREAQCQNLINRTVEAYGRIDTLVNNAGITMWALFEDLESTALLEKIMRVNYLSSVYCTYAALPYLKQSRGRIVAITSLTALNGVPTRTGYAASKHAMKGFFDSLRIELADSGVTVTISYPDFVATGMRDRALGVNGKPIGASPLEEQKVMTTQTSVQILVKAMEKRKRDDKQTLRAKLGPWVKLIAPGLIDNIAKKAVQTDE
jgi:short-subunit dehydrogenase